MGVADRDIGAIFGQPLRNRRADAPAAACDQRYLPAKLHPFLPSELTSLHSKSSRLSPTSAGDRYNNISSSAERGCETRVWHPEKSSPKNRTTTDPRCPPTSS